MPRGEVGFVLASGAATCASWLCYYRALQNGPSSVVMPFDRLNLLVTVFFSALVLREVVGRRDLIGLILLVGAPRLAAPVIENGIQEFRNLPILLPLEARLLLMDLHEKLKACDIPGILSYLRLAI